MLQKIVLCFLVLVNINTISIAQNNQNLITNNLEFQKDSIANWSLHYQFTGIVQGHGAFNAKYSGANSVINANEPGAYSITTTLFLGRKLWKNASLYINPETAGGTGISSTKGIAGFTNGETFRVGNPQPALYFARFYAQQIFALKNTKSEWQTSDKNQLAQKLPSNRIVLTAGKFSNADFFDDNIYCHDPRTQFFNWSLMSTGAWDYAANTRGYSYGIVAEYFSPKYEARISTMLEPKLANGPKMEWNIKEAKGTTIEIVKNWNHKNKTGKISLLAFYNQSAAPLYTDATNLLLQNNDSLQNMISGLTTNNIFKGKKIGLGLNAHQDINENIGCFARASYNDGKYATWAFTEIDNSISFGAVAKLAYIKRPDDNLGLAFVSNGISKVHQQYYAAGGLGFMLGDGNLNYARENILELYYNAHFSKYTWLTLDYQVVKNPGYNSDRGTIPSVWGIRFHTEY